MDLYRPVEDDSSCSQGGLLGDNSSSPTAMPCIHVNGAQLETSAEQNQQSKLRRVGTDTTLGPWSLESYLTPLSPLHTPTVRKEFSDGYTDRLTEKTIGGRCASSTVDSACAASSSSRYVGSSGEMCISNRRKTQTHPTACSDLQTSNHNDNSPTHSIASHSAVAWPSIGPDTTGTGMTQAFTASSSNSTIRSTRTASTRVSNEAEVRTDLKKTLIVWEGRLYPVLIGPGGSMWEGPCARVGCEAHIARVHRSSTTWADTEVCRDVRRAAACVSTPPNKLLGSLHTTNKQHLCFSNPM